MDQDRVAETLKAAVAYQLLTVAADCDQPRQWHPAMAHCIKRLVDDADYRAIVLDCWAEIFERQNGEMFDALKDMMEGTPLWEELVSLKRPSASHTDDTQRISKN